MTDVLNRSSSIGGGGGGVPVSSPSGANNPARGRERGNGDGAERATTTVTVRRREGAEEFTMPATRGSTRAFRRSRAKWESRPRPGPLTPMPDEMEPPGGEGSASAAPSAPGAAAPTTVTTTTTTLTVGTGRGGTAASSAGAEPAGASAPIFGSPSFSAPGAGAFGGAPSCPAATNGISLPTVGGVVGTAGAKGAAATDADERRPFQFSFASSGGGDAGAGFGFGAGINFGATAGAFGGCGTPADGDSNRPVGGVGEPVIHEGAAGKTAAARAEAAKTDDDGGDVTADHRRRLVEFYQKYNPSRLPSVDSTLEKYRGREDEMFDKLTKKYCPPSNDDSEPSGEGPTCYLDVSIGGGEAGRGGRIRVKLYADKCPLTAQNFAALCRGDHPNGGKLHYGGCTFHRIVPGFVAQGGDFMKGDGTGGRSIYPPGTPGVSDAWGKFVDEEAGLAMSHSRRGVLSMANNGRNANGSQFFVTLARCTHLDGKHCVFGEVVDGWDVLDAMEKVPRGKGDRPLEDHVVRVVDCGQEGDGAASTDDRGGRAAAPPAATVASGGDPRDPPVGGTTSVFGTGFARTAAGESSSAAASKPLFGGGFDFGGDGGGGGGGGGVGRGGPSPSSTQPTASEGGSGAFGFAHASSKAPPAESQPTTFGGGFNFGAGAPFGGNVPTGGGDRAKGGAVPPPKDGAQTTFGATKATETKSGGYPPLSSKAPSPAFPPMSSKAPSPFSGGGQGAASAAPKTVDSGAYPPLSSKAPIPFGGQKSLAHAAVASTAGSTGSYPPLSAKAPSPFSEAGATATAAATGTPSTAFPPISSKAPSPFSGSGPKVASAAPMAPKAVDSGAYPPLSTKAPTAFGGGKSQAPAAAASKAVSSGSYPPMSFKAPSPFSATGATAAAASTATLPAAFPPVSSKAPLPFSGSGARAASTDPEAVVSGPFPPSSSQAPTPFGGEKSKPHAAAASVAASSSSYPPMSRKAPSPFSGSGSNAVAASAVAASAPTASFPPTSSKAPSPFPGRGTGAASAAPKAGNSGACPPLPSKAPTPFGGEKSKAPGAATSKAASSGSYPPMSVKAPSPFSGTGAKAVVLAPGLAPASASASASAYITSNKTAPAATAPTPFSSTTQRETKSSLPFTAPKSFNFSKEDNSAALLNAGVGGRANATNPFGVAKAETSSSWDAGDAAYLPFSSFPRSFSTGGGTDGASPLPGAFGLGLLGSRPPFGSESDERPGTISTMFRSSLPGGVSFGREHCFESSKRHSAPSPRTKSMLGSEPALVSKMLAGTDSTSPSSLFPTGSTTGGFSTESYGLLGNNNGTDEDTDTGECPPAEPEVVFGSGSSVKLGVASSRGGFAALAADKTTSPDTSPFAAFSKPKEPHTAAADGACRLSPRMIKPLFGDQPTKEAQSLPKAIEDCSKKPTLLPLQKADIPREPSSSPEGKSVSPSSESTMKAGKVFDAMDKDQSGNLPSSLFESLVEEVGEGFHGDELRRQLSLVDAEGTGVIERSCFVQWYSDLVNGDEGEVGSLDSDEAAERAEELSKAVKAFQDIAGADEATIPEGDFKALMEALGTTYCEEEHVRTIKKLGVDGRISQNAFTSWYVYWLYGADTDVESEGESENADDDEGSSKKETTRSGGVEENNDGWGKCFKVDEGSWKCESCMVRNNSDAIACASCEASRPGHEVHQDGPVDGQGCTERIVGSGIGAGGFTFGGSLETSDSAVEDVLSTTNAGIDDGGFKFGGKANEEQEDTDSGSAGRCFTFGGSTTIASVEKKGPSGTTNGSGESTFDGEHPMPKSEENEGKAAGGSEIGSGGFIFCGSAEKNGSLKEDGQSATGASISTGGFTFGGGRHNVSTATTSARPVTKTEGASMTSSSTTSVSEVPGEDKESSVISQHGIAAANASSLHPCKNVHVPQDPMSAQDGKYVSPACEDSALKAEKVFDAMDKDQSGNLPSSLFESLVEEVGEGFHGDELKRQLSLVDAEGTGVIERSCFVQWYSDLVNGDEGEVGSLDSDEAAERAEELSKAVKAFQGIAGADEATIPEGDFKALMEALGTTYCEEEHVRTIKKLGVDGRISQNAFTSWYVYWLFGADTDVESKADDDGAKETTRSGGVEENNDGWGKCFKVDEGSWKCESCMVRNNSDAIACASCEASRPGHEVHQDGPVDGQDCTERIVGFSIGAGGFTFGGSLGTSDSATEDVLSTTNAGIDAGGFKFGGNKAASESIAKKEQEDTCSAFAGRGFTFGESAAASKSVEKKEPSASNPPSCEDGLKLDGNNSIPGSEKIEAKAAAGSGISAGGFTFGGRAASGSLEKKGQSDTAAGIGVDGLGCDGDVTQSKLSRTSIVDEAQNLGNGFGGGNRALNQKVFGEHDENSASNGNSKGNYAVSPWPPSKKANALQAPFAAVDGQGADPKSSSAPSVGKSSDGLIVPKSKTEASGVSLPATFGWTSGSLPTFGGKTAEVDGATTRLSGSLERHSFGKAQSATANDSVSKIAKGGSVFGSAAKAAAPVGFSSLAFGGAGSGGFAALASSSPERVGFSGFGSGGFKSFGAGTKKNSEGEARGTNPLAAQTSTGNACQSSIDTDAALAESPSSHTANTAMDTPSLFAPEQVYSSGGFRERLPYDTSSSDESDGSSSDD